MLTQERLREFLAEEWAKVGGSPVPSMFVRDTVALSAMTRAVQEAVEEAAKVAEARVLQLGKNTPEWWIAQQITTAIRVINKGA